MAKSIAFEAFLGVCTTINILLVSFALFLFAVSYQIIHNHFFHPLASYPGPFLAGVTRIWIAWHNYLEDETAICWKLVQKHGLADPDVFQT